MRKTTAKRIAGLLFAIGWLPFRRRFAMQSDGLRWKWLAFWENRALQWGRFWNNHLASPEEHVQ